MTSYGAGELWMMTSGRRSNIRAGQGGATVSELLVGLAVLALAAVVTLPALGRAQRNAALEAVSGRLSAQLARCRAFSVFNRCNTALVFDRVDGRWCCFVAQDGDGDGVRRRDLADGSDQRIGTVVLLEGRTAGLGMLQGCPIPDPSGRGRLQGDLDDPVRAGRSNMVSFSPEGTASPSSLYVTDHRQRMQVLRTHGITGRFRVLEWEPGWKHWRRVR